MATMEASPVFHTSSNAASLNFMRRRPASIDGSPIHRTGETPTAIYPPPSLIPLRTWEATGEEFVLFDVQQEDEGGGGLQLPLDIGGGDISHLDWSGSDGTKRRSPVCLVELTKACDCIECNQWMSTASRLISLRHLRRHRTSFSSCCSDATPCGSIAVPRLRSSASFISLQGINKAAVRGESDGDSETNDNNDDDDRDEAEGQREKRQQPLWMLPKPLGGHDRGGEKCKAVLSTICATGHESSALPSAFPTQPLQKPSAMRRGESVHHRNVRSVTFPKLPRVDVESSAGGSFMSSNVDDDEVEEGEDASSTKRTAIAPSCFFSRIYALPPPPPGRLVRSVSDEASPQHRFWVSEREKDEAEVEEGPAAATALGHEPVLSARTASASYRGSPWKWSFKAKKFSSKQSQLEDSPAFSNPLGIFFKPNRLQSSSATATSHPGPRRLTATERRQSLQLGAQRGPEGDRRLRVGDGARCQAPPQVLLNAFPLPHTSCQTAATAESEAEKYRLEFALIAREIGAEEAVAVLQRGVNPTLILRQENKVAVAAARLWLDIEPKSQGPPRLILASLKGVERPVLLGASPPSSDSNSLQFLNSGRFPEGWSMTRLEGETFVTLAVKNAPSNLVFVFCDKKEAETLGDVVNVLQELRERLRQRRRLAGLSPASTVPGPSNEHLCLTSSRSLQDFQQHTTTASMTSSNQRSGSGWRRMVSRRIMMRQNDAT